MNWKMLVPAIALEAAWAICMKMSRGFSVPVPSVLTAVFYAASLVFLALATKHADVGTTYAVWAGSGAVLVALAGVFHFHEPMTVLRAVSLALIVAGLVGVNLAESAPR